MLYPFSRLFSPARSRPLCAAEARKKRRGFNLIESAIVLGVVGLLAAKDGD
jgi:prepilin-type N-terminal cleavage/methylation domain-containing protein